MLISKIIHHVGFRIVASNTTVKHLSTNADKLHYNLLIIGGGSGGSAIAARFGHKLGSRNVAVIEPSSKHYYQPIWTLVGAGLCDFNKSERDNKDIIGKTCQWIQDRVMKFSPKDNTVYTEKGQEVSYDYMVVAMGVQLDYHKIKGALEALEEDPSVVSNYHPNYVKKTFPALKNFTGGNAVFSFPNGPIKCAGAPQKIAYLAEDYFTRTGKRSTANIIYNTTLPAVFGIPKYAKALLKVINERNINLNTRTNLIEIKHDTKEAIFENLDSGEINSLNYNFLHVSPPCSAPDILKESNLVDNSGFLDVDKLTLQHSKFSNIFGIGDCTNLPTAKTAAGVAAQTGILTTTLKEVMNGEKATSLYNGYTSCPLLTKKGGCILAEFGYDGKVLETFPMDQGVERWTMFQAKANIMPNIYWYLHVKGLWGGPGFMRKVFHPLS